MNPLYEDQFDLFFDSSSLTVAQRADLVVPKAAIELPETDSPPQTSNAIVKSGPGKKMLVPSETLLTPR